MYAVIRRYNTHDRSARRIAERVREGFVPLVSRLPGFVSYDVISADDGTMLSVGVFLTRSAAEDSSRLASDWAYDNLSSLVRTAPVILSGEVVIHHMAGVPGDSTRSDGMALGASSPRAAAPAA